jgi:ring-1,2-phenylacetyl-CoA epoxidase subunit PaaE
MAPRFFHLQVAEIRPETDEAVSVGFVLPDDIREHFRFEPGQYLTLKAEIAGEEVRRSYSICSARGEPDLRVAIKTVEGGRFSSFANSVLKAGDTIEVMPPVGRFTVPLDPANRNLYVAFAAGAGITPVMSIVKTVLTNEPDSRCILFYGNRNTASIIFREQLEDLKNRYLGRLSIYHVLSREAQEFDLLNGRLDGDKAESLCRAFAPPALVDEAFVCGPSGMIDEVRAALARIGVPGAKVHFERFTTGAESAPTRRSGAQTAATVARSTVAVIIDGVRTEFPLGHDDDTILNAAHKQGVDLPFSCKGGVCATCRAKVLEGEVEMDVNYALEPAEVEAGFVLTCQSRPLTERVVVDYDQS